MSATIVPFKLREVVSLRENAAQHLTYLEPEHRRRVWKWIKHQLRKGLHRLERELAIRLRLELPTGVCVYGAAVVEGVVLVVRIFGGSLSLYAVIHPWRLAKASRNWDCPVLLEKVDGEGFMFRIAIAVTAANHLVFECAGNLTGIKMPLGYSLPLCA